MSFWKQWQEWKMEVVMPFSAREDLAKLVDERLAAQRERETADDE